MFTFDVSAKVIFAYVFLTDWTFVIMFSNCNNMILGVFLFHMTASVRLTEGLRTKLATHIGILGHSAMFWRGRIYYIIRLKYNGEPQSPKNLL